MFTGIIESIGIVKNLTKEEGNVHLRMWSSFTNELKVDQSVAHNGVCLTVVEIDKEEYVVTAIKETLDKTNLSSLKIGSEVNLERCMKLGDRLDGHIVQGHVDGVGACIGIESDQGSTIFTFEYDFSNITVEKGSITINGVSLTVVNSKKGQFSVAIIPFTLEYTTFKNIQIGDPINLEFDVVGKYVARLMELRD
jgi:riboflavin synthase